MKADGIHTFVTTIDEDGEQPEDHSALSSTTSPETPVHNAIRDLESLEAHFLMTQTPIQSKAMLQLP